jgi:type I restriction enzyme S subunit
VSSAANVDPFDAWLSNLPTGWSLKKVGREFACIGSGTTPPTDSQKWYGEGFPWVTTGELRENVITSTAKSVTADATREFTTLRRYGPGTLLVAMYGATIGRLAMLGCEATTNQACCALSEPLNLEPKYVFYWLQAFRDQLVRKASGGGQPNVNQDTIRALKISSPSRTSQQGIVNFLDDKTAWIDALIAEKESLAGALAEYMASQLEAAFTGVELEGPLKQTGSIFFPALPYSWQPTALKHLVSTPVADGPHETPEFVPDGVPFVSAEAIKRGLVDFDRKRGYITPELHATYCQKTKPQRDDVFMVKSGNTTGAVAIVETDDEFSVWSPLAVLRANLSKILPRFLYLAMQTPYFQRSIQLFWSHGTQPNIGMAVIENLQIAVPPVAEQQAIVERMGLLRAKVEGLNMHCAEHIARLREYRSSLISAAVTGQLDIGSFKESA